MCFIAQIIFLKYSRHSPPSRYYLTTPFNLHLVVGTSCSFWIWLFTFTVVIAAIPAISAILSCWKPFTFTSSWFWFTYLNYFWLHRSSNEYKRWAASSRKDLLTCSLTDLVMLLRLGKSWWTISVFQCPSWYTTL